MNDRKVDPDLLLQDLKKGDHKKGKLRIFLGMCPGVGKTYAMLRAAHDRKLEKLDIVVGVVETHSRIETESLIKDLEVVPKIVTDYKGTTLYEMDLDAILKRNPKLVLVDELAHTNIPGSRHAKRYMDVLELLNNGVDVYTTVNIQHIDTRSILVTQITGIHITETVPDSILTDADQVDLIDLTPEELLKRLKDGKVYLGERADRALDNFFKIEHLIALRELALRFTAEIVDQHLQIEMSQRGIQGPWNTNERLLVAISHSPYSQTLIKATRRMAYNLESPWIALFVNTESYLSVSDQEQLNKNIALAKELGAEFISIHDNNVVDAIKRIANQRNVSQIIMGRPDKRISDILNKGTILERLTSEASNIDIHVLRQDRPSKVRLDFSDMFVMHSGLHLYYNAFWLICLFSLLNYSLQEIIGYRSVGFIFLFLVLIVSSFAGRGPIFFTAFVSAIIWDYFFIPPKYTLTITHKDDIVLCITYLVVALVTGYLANQRNKQKESLKKREENLMLMYETTKELSKANSLDEIANVAVRSIEKYVSGKCFFYSIENKELMTVSRKSLTMPFKKLDDKEYAVASWGVLNKKNAGWSTETLSSSAILVIPIFKDQNCYGVMVIEPNRKHKLNFLQESTLETIISNVTMTTDRYFLNKEKENAKLIEESEKLHQSLLNSISHELKIPITSILGVALAFKDTVIPDKTGNQEMLDNLIDSSYRLNRVVENLLDMSRISNGHLKLNQEWFEFKDLIHNVLIQNKILNNHFKISFPEKDFYVLGDTKLIEHAIFNVLLNSVQHSTENQLVNLSIVYNEQKIFFKVSDQGNGIPIGEESKIFERFYRAKNSKPGGTGLGLSIVKEVFELHRGTVRAFNNSDFGCTFELELNYTSEIK
jgi:two-component system sensor histidine kinase KdpD